MQNNFNRLIFENGEVIILNLNIMSFNALFGMGHMIYLYEIYIIIIDVGETWNNDTRIYYYPFIV